MSADNQNNHDEAPDEEVQELMESHDLDEDTAEQVREIMDKYGVDEDDAVELGKKGVRYLFFMGLKPVLVVGCRPIF